MTSTLAHEGISSPPIDEQAIASTEGWTEPTFVEASVEKTEFNPKEDAEQLELLRVATDSTIEAYEAKIIQLTDVKEADDGQDKTIEELVSKLRAQQAERDRLKLELARETALTSHVWEQLHEIKAQLPALMTEQAQLASELTELQAELSEPVAEVKVKFERCPCEGTIETELEATHLPAEHSGHLQAELAAKKKHYEQMNMDDHYAKQKRAIDMRLAYQKRNAKMMTEDEVDALQVEHTALNQKSAETKAEASLQFTEAQKALEAFEASIEAERQKLQRAAQEVAEAERANRVQLFEEKMGAYTDLSLRTEKLGEHYAQCNSLLRMFEDAQFRLSAEIDIAQSRLDEIVGEYTAARKQQLLAIAALSQSPTSTKAPAGQTTTTVVYKKLAGATS